MSDVLENDIELEPGHDLEEIPEDDLGSDEPAESKIEQAARQRGWTPKEEWQGEEGDWVDAVDYITSHADRVEKRTEKRLKFIEQEFATLKPTIESVDKRVEATTKKDRDTLEREWDQAIYDHDRSDVAGYNKLLRDRKAALADFDKTNAPKAETKQSQPTIDPAAMDFMERHQNLVNPSNADEKATRTWVIGRLEELEAKYPAASTQQLYNQMEKELNARTKGTKTPEPEQRGNPRARTVARSSSPAGRQPGAKGLADLSSEQRKDIEWLVEKGVYNKNGKTHEERLNFAAKRYWDGKK